MGLSLVAPESGGAAEPWRLASTTAIHELLKCDRSDRAGAMGLTFIAPAPVY